MILGSEDAGCQISSKIIITLTGPRSTVSDMGSDPFDGSNFHTSTFTNFQAALGTKGIAFATGSNAEFHGKTYGASWGRITQNVYPSKNLLFFTYLTFKTTQSFISIPPFPGQSAAKSF